MLHYMSLDPIHRKLNHDNLTFSFFYAFSENFILPISHYEVAPWKMFPHQRNAGCNGKSLLDSAFIAYMMSHPGEKIDLYGTEFAQFIEWK